MAPLGKSGIFFAVGAAAAGAAAGFFGEKIHGKIRERKSPEMPSLDVAGIVSRVEERRVTSLRGVRRTVRITFVGGETYLLVNPGISASLLMGNELSTHLVDLGARDGDEIVWFTFKIGLLDLAEDV